MAIAKILLVDDEVPFVETMIKRLTKREMDVIAGLQWGRGAGQAERAAPHRGGDSGRQDAGHGRDRNPDGDQEGPPLVEVIMLTGHATVESAIDGMKKGAFDYLMKPCDIEVLVSKVAEAAAKKRRHEEKIIEAQMREITTRRT
jgi:DNA-binding NtrC family response regulator